MFIKESKYEKPTYICDKCGRKMIYRPKRLVKQLYGNGNYNQYGTVEHYDLCNKCYLVFDKWISKHKGV